MFVHLGLPGEVASDEYDAVQMYLSAIAGMLIKMGSAPTIEATMSMCIIIVTLASNLRALFTASPKSLAQIQPIIEDGGTTDSLQRIVMCMFFEQALSRRSWLTLIMTMLMRANKKIPLKKGESAMLSRSLGLVSAMLITPIIGRAMAANLTHDDIAAQVEITMRDLLAIIATTLSAGYSPADMNRDILRHLLRVVAIAVTPDQLETILQYCLHPGKKAANIDLVAMGLIEGEAPVAGFALITDIKATTKPQITREGPNGYRVVGLDQKPWCGVAIDSSIPATYHVVVTKIGGSDTTVRITTGNAVLPDDRAGWSSSGKIARPIPGKKSAYDDSPHGPVNMAAGPINLTIVVTRETYEVFHLDRSQFKSTHDGLPIVIGQKGCSIVIVRDVDDANDGGPPGGPHLWDEQKHDPPRQAAPAQAAEEKHDPPRAAPAQASPPPLHFVDLQGVSAAGLIQRLARDASRQS
jgi:hypothetical protein